ncbi:hypothetical protein Droror1_Dr00009906 [Drosera rotundifolia]
MSNSADADDGYTVDVSDYSSKPEDTGDKAMLQTPALASGSYYSDFAFVDLSKQFSKSEMNEVASFPSPGRTSQSTNSREFVPDRYSPAQSQLGDLSSLREQQERSRTDQQWNQQILPPSRDIRNQRQGLVNQQNSKQEKKEESHRRNKKKFRKQYYKMHMEAVQNIRNTITVVAILIATIAFTGAITPPGSVYQDGPLIGEPILGRTTSYKVFIICNDIALFLSLSIVLMLVTIIPFKSKPLMQLVFVAHKIVWAAVAFITTAYIAARWATMYHATGTRWMSAVLVSICGGLLTLLFFGLSVMLVNDRLRKSRWKSTMEKLSMAEQEEDMYSINSDVESNLGRGYHSH